MREVRLEKVELQKTLNTANEFLADRGRFVIFNQAHAELRTNKNKLSNFDGPFQIGHNAGGKRKYTTRTNSKNQHMLHQTPPHSYQLLLTTDSTMER